LPHQVRRRSAARRSCTEPCAASLIRWLFDVRRDRQDPDQPVDHRGHAREQPDRPGRAPPQGSRRELGHEDRRERRDDEADQHRQPGRQQRAPDQRPGPEVVDRVPGQRRASASPAAACPTSPPGPNQLRPLCENDGHASTNTVTSIARSAPVHPQPARRAQARRACPASSPTAQRRALDVLTGLGCGLQSFGLPCQWIAIHSELTILRDGQVAGLVTQSMNFADAPFGAPLVTIQKLRTPPY
jgi:hypothetical protein